MKNQFLIHILGFFQFFDFPELNFFLDSVGHFRGQFCDVVSYHQSTPRDLTQFGAASHIFWGYLSKQKSGLLLLLSCCSKKKVWPEGKANQIKLLKSESPREGKKL